MNKLTVIVFLLFITSQSFAGSKLYTDEDLENYSGKPDGSYEGVQNIRQDSPDIKDEIINKQEQLIRNQQNTIEVLKKDLEGPPKILPGKDCEVLDYTAWTYSYAVFNPDVNAVIDGIAYGSVVTKQKANAKVKNNFGLNRWVKDFRMIAVFQDGSSKISQLQPKQGDHSTTQVAPHEIYSGHVTFDSEESIVSLGCIMNPGL